MWTERSPTMRILDPLSAESTESTVQSRMFYPVLSIAITQRLRYLSYWCWVTEHTDSIDDADRALYEKVMLLGSAPHECPDVGTGQNGTLNPESDIQAQLEDPAVQTIDIDADNVSIASNDVARFDSYYAGVLYNLLLLEDSQTVTPLGRALAGAYDDAVSFSFADVEAAVDQKELPRELIEQVTATGCPCQLSGQEQQLLRQAYWYLVSPTSEYDQLTFSEQPRPELLELREYLETDQRQLAEAAKKAELIGVDEAEYEARSEDLEQFFVEGRAQFVRSSLTLLLAAADWVTRRPTETPDFGNLADAREIWRLLVHAEDASYAIQSLFLAVQGTVREREPIGPGEVLSTLFTSETFADTAGQALAGIELSTVDGDERGTLERIRDAVYYGEAPDGELQHSLPKSGSVPPVSGSWDDVQAQLIDRDDGDSDSPFHLSGSSERAFRTALEEELSTADSVAGYQRVAAIASVLVARIGTRYEQYFGTEQMEPYRMWFETAHGHPGARTCWEVNNPDSAEFAFGSERIGSDWECSEFARTAAAFTKQWTLENYFQDLFSKIGESNGRSPQLLHIDSDGLLTFDYASNSGALYNYGQPNAPTLKWDRLGDILYELGFTSSNDLNSMELEQPARNLITQFTEGDSS